MMGSELHVDPGEWDAAVGDTGGAQLVVGGPGSGKTEFLVRRAHHLITEGGVPPDQVLLLSFSRRGVADLRRRLDDRLDRSFTRVPALTFHALALRIIEAHGAAGDWPEIPTPLTGPEQVALVAEILAGEDPATWPLPYRSLLTTRSFANEVADFCSRAAERLIGPDAIGGFGRADWRGLPGFIHRYREALVDRGRIDYGSLQTEAIRLLGDPDVRDTVRDSIHHVLVDEYQDTTVAQAALLEALVGRDGNITAAGDPYQSVYSFRGAELANVADFGDRFGSSERPARRIVLTTSFRVPAAILDAAVRVTAGIGLPGAAGPVRPARGRGSVETYRFDQASHEAEWIASEAQRINLVDGTPFQRMAVLVRSKRTLLTELSRALDRRRIPHDRPGERLVEHPAVRPIVDLVTAAVAEGAQRSAAIRRLLLGTLVGLPLSAARELERRSLRGEEWAELLAEGEPAVVEIGTLLDDTTWATAAPAADGFWHVWTTMSGFGRLVERPEAAESRAALTSFGQALERLRERDAEATLADHLETIAAEDFEAEPLLEYRSPDRGQVTLTTLHQAKGLDFDVVFIADAREGVVPDLRQRDSILGARHLSPIHRGDDAAYARFRLQEEMRLVYTAMCRARVRVVVTCTSMGVELGGGAPSRVLTLVAGRPMEEAAVAPPVDHDPVTPQEAEAWLRRLLRDPGRPAATRLAALAALADGGDWQPRPATEFAGVLRRGPDTGVIPAAPILSPSQAESYRTCPRRYVFERPLRIGSTGSAYASLGGLIHDVLEIVERVASDRGDEHATGEEALAVLDERFDPADFGGEPWARSWRQRAARIIDHLYDRWPGHGPAEALEHEVSREIGSVTWMGRVDRLERRTDGVWVIDYKTGTSVPSTDDAKSSLQLGFYVSTIGADAAGAEFWYPAAKSVGVTRRAFDMGRLPEVEAALLEVQGGILREDWTPLPGPHCERCDHRILCPAWPEGAEAYSS
jgi:superfamily I DNA/RNA helicase/RecB family exonuclease